VKSRKTNRAKRVSSGCRNHGTCGVCRGNRTAANERAVPADAAEQEALAARWPYGHELDDCGDDYDAWCGCASCGGWDEDVALPEPPRFTFGEVFRARAA
jgi:hypothetical protein